MNPYIAITIARQRMDEVARNARNCHSLQPQERTSARWAGPRVEWQALVHARSARRVVRL